MEQTPTQTRLKKFTRSEDPEMFAGVQITGRDIELIGKIASYRFIPSAYLVRLVDDLMEVSRITRGTLRQVTLIG